MTTLSRSFSFLLLISSGPAPRADEVWQGRAPNRTQVPSRSAGYCRWAGSGRSSHELRLTASHCFPFMWGLLPHANQCGIKTAASHAIFPLHPNSRDCRNGQDPPSVHLGTEQLWGWVLPSSLGGVVSLSLCPVLLLLWLRGHAAEVQDVSFLFFPPPL